MRARGIELELNHVDEFYLIKYSVSDSDEDGDDERVIDLFEVIIEGHDILDLLAETIIVDIKMKIREQLNN